MEFNDEVIWAINCLKDHLFSDGDVDLDTFRRDLKEDMMGADLADIISEIIMERNLTDDEQKAFRILHHLNRNYPDKINLF